MSDQQETVIDVVLDLEGLFLSREFGRRPARSISSAPASVASEPAQLEQVFLSEVFGHPEVVVAATQAVGPSAPAASGRPALVLLEGGAEGGFERDRTRARAIAAVSGVAAAALVIAGLSTGSGHGPGQPTVTEQAQGAPSGQGAPGPGDGSQSGPAVANLFSGQSNGGTPAGSAALASFSTPVSAVVPQGATGGGAIAPPAPAPTVGGQPPGTPPSSGAGSGVSSVLTPALNVVGNEVSSVGSSVTSTSGDLGQALPVSSVLQALGGVATSAVNNLGGGSPPNILAGTLN